MRNVMIESLIEGYVKGMQTVRQVIAEQRQRAIEISDHNAWIHILSEAELEPFLTRLEHSDPSSLPLFGIPFAIKDNIDLAGVPTTAGCKEFEYVPNKSAYVVQRLIDAGAVPIGKTNLDQFATGLVGVRSPFGEGKNVFNTEYISGGSSSGSAIATALGVVSFALGTDTAGSGRVPAALNNIVGLKPSKGLLSTEGVVPACKTLDCVSIFALTTEDASRVFDVAASHNVQDDYSQPNIWQNQSIFLNQESRVFNFGVPDSLEFFHSTECENLFNQTVSALEKLGGKRVVINFQPFREAATLLYQGPWVAERQWATRNVNRQHMLPVIAEIVDSATDITAVDTFDSFYKLAKLKSEANAQLNEVDFILTPTTPTVFTREEIRNDPIRLNSVLGTYTNFMNLLDYSATSIPVGFLSSGVSWGVTLFSYRNEDIKVLGFAGLLHQTMSKFAGKTSFELPEDSVKNTTFIAETTDIVVCGAHLSDMPLNWQLKFRGGQLKERTKTQSCYRLYALPDGNRPALVQDIDGAAIDVEIWTLPTEAFGSFVAGIPAPLGIGKTILKDGRIVPGYICEANQLAGATEITVFGGWKNWKKQAG